MPFLCFVIALITSYSHAAAAAADDDDDSFVLSVIGKGKEEFFSLLWLRFAIYWNESFVKCDRHLNSEKEKEDKNNDRYYLKHILPFTPPSLSHSLIHSLT